MCRHRRVNRRAVAERYHGALDAKPSKGPITDSGIAAITDSVADVPQLLAEVERLSRWKSEEMIVAAGLQELGRALGIPLGVPVTGSMATDLAARLKAQNARYAQRIANMSSSMQELLDVALVDVKANIDALLNRLLRLTMASDDGTPYEHNGHPEGEGEPNCPACWAADILAAIAGPTDG